MGSAAIDAALRKRPVAATVSTADFVMRLVYFACVPFLLTIVALVLPITGIVVNVVLAVAVYFLAKRIRKVKVLSKVLGRALRFEAYYREHPPKPFLYYVFFPLLFPYWLIVGSARKEIGAYRAFSTMSVVILIGLSAYRYFARFRPEISFKAFLVFAAIGVALELVVTMLFLMPLATSVIAYHASGKHKRLAALGVVAALSFGVKIYFQIVRPPIITPLEVQRRASLRTEAAGQHAHEVLEGAARAGLDEIALEDDKLPDSLHYAWIEGAGPDAARAKLAELYKPDECDAFQLTIVHTKSNHEALLLFLARSGSEVPRVWLAIDAAGKKLRDDVIPERELLAAQLSRKPAPMKRRRKTPGRAAPAPASASVETPAASP